VSTAGTAPWRRLDPRMLVVGPVGGLVKLIPVAALLLLTGRRGDPTQFWITVGLAGALVLAGVLRWRTTLPHH
jgi:putative membrane protein